MQTNVWQRLQTALKRLPRCPQQRQYRCVRTLPQGVVNDIISISPEGVKVRSHRTGVTNLIKASKFEKWWDHLAKKRPASLRPGDPNNPDPYRSRIVGAIFAACFPRRIRVENNNTIRLV